MPLSYFEYDAQMPIVMPNSLMYESGMIPENDPDIITDKYLGKRAQFIKKCKEIVWSR